MTSWSKKDDVKNFVTIETEVFEKQNVPKISTFKQLEKYLKALALRAAISKGLTFS